MKLPWEGLGAVTIPTGTQMQLQGANHFLTVELSCSYKNCLRCPLISIMYFNLKKYKNVLKELTSLEHLFCAVLSHVISFNPQGSLRCSMSSQETTSDTLHNFPHLERERTETRSWVYQSPGSRHLSFSCLLSSTQHERITFFSFPVWGYEVGLQSTFIYLFIYLFGCFRSELWYMRSSLQHVETHCDPQAL